MSLKKFFEILLAILAVIGLFILSKRPSITLEFYSQNLDANPAEQKFFLEFAQTLRSELPRLSANRIKTGWTVKAELESELGNLAVINISGHRTSQPKEKLLSMDLELPPPFDAGQAADRARAEAEKIIEEIERLEKLNKISRRTTSADANQRRRPHPAPPFFYLHHSRLIY